MNFTQITGLLVTAALMGGCAGPNTGAPKTAFAKRVDLQDGKRAREANVAISAFLGMYRVVDSRINSAGVDAAAVVLLAGVPTLRLWRQGGAELAVELQANDCAGDVVNSFSQDMYLACFGSSLYSNRKPFFSVSRVTRPVVEKSGSLIPAYEPMTVAQGYLIRYDLGDPYGRTIPLAVLRKEGGAQ
ncbi:MAG: hypothetical protein KF796_02705 [Ramlibacter sp.]|nr:hypothetical protein [Ramlibacter sp.]